MTCVHYSAVLCCYMMHNRTEQNKEEERDRGSSWIEVGAAAVCTSTVDRVEVERERERGTGFGNRGSKKERERANSEQRTAGGAGTDSSISAAGYIRVSELPLPLEHVRGKAVVVIQEHKPYDEQSS